MAEKPLTRDEAVAFVLEEMSPKRRAAWLVVLAQDEQIKQLAARLDRLEQAAGLPERAPQKFTMKVNQVVEEADIVLPKCLKPKDGEG